MQQHHPVPIQLDDNIHFLDSNKIPDILTGKLHIYTTEGGTGGSFVIIGHNQNYHVKTEDPYTACTSYFANHFLRTVIDLSMFGGGIMVPRYTKLFGPCLNVDEFTNHFGGNLQIEKFHGYIARKNNGIMISEILPGFSTCGAGNENSVFTALLQSNPRFWPAFGFICCMDTITRYDDRSILSFGFNPHNLVFNIDKSTRMLKVGCIDNGTKKPLNHVALNDLFDLTHIRQMIRTNYEYFGNDRHQNIHYFFSGFTSGMKILSNFGAKDIENLYGSTFNFIDHFLNQPIESKNDQYIHEVLGNYRHYLQELSDNHVNFFSDHDDFGNKKITDINEMVNQDYPLNQNLNPPVKKKK